MFLRELRVENLRAIRSAVLRLDPTTVLIGENDCGLSSLLHALELVLGAGADGAAQVPAGDFHLRPGESRPAGPLRISLAFEERTPREWSSAEHAEVQRLLPPAGKTRRSLELEATAGPVPAGRHSAPLSIRVRGARNEDGERRLLAHVRRMSPLVRVSGGTITGHDSGAQAHPSRRASGPGIEPEIAGLVECISTAAEGLLVGRDPDPSALLQEGFQAARELLARRPQHIDPGSGGLAGSVLEILGQDPDRPRRDGPADESATAPVAEQLGALLLTAALLRRIPAGLDLGCEPIWAIEAPEAHLHPMTLAAVARLLERIRWQKILSTHSGDLLARLPLGQVRRLVRHEGRVLACSVRPRALSREDLRRVAHHLRARRGVAMFARVWLLVEGESEFWILPQLAQVLGHDLDVAGIACVEYAQSGLEPLLRTARELGIDWHLLADGDEAGRGYAATAHRFVRPGEAGERITLLRERDLEHCLWNHGHAEALRLAAGLTGGAGQRASPRRVIAQAVRRRSKPGLALAVIESVARRGTGGVPAPLARVVESCLRLAQRAPVRLAGSASPVRASD